MRFILKNNFIPSPNNRFSFRLRKTSRISTTNKKYLSIVLTMKSSIFTVTFSVWISFKQISKEMLFCNWNTHIFSFFTDWKLEDRSSSESFRLLKLDWHEVDNNVRWNFQRDILRISGLKVDSQFVLVFSIHFQNAFLYLSSICILVESTPGLFGFHQKH